MADNTAKPSVLTEHLISLAEGHKESLGLKGIFYGDQKYIPEVPALCIEPATVIRELSGTAMRTRNEFAVSMLMYAADVEGSEDAQRQADTFAEAWVDVVNQDGIDSHQPGSGTAFNGLVIYGYVQSSEYGYAVKDNKLMRANRMIVYAMSKTNLLEA